MKKVGNFLWGIVFIVLGSIIALNALEITHINIFFNGWWTLFIIIPCFIGLFKDREKTGNLIGLFVGIVLLLCCQGLFQFRVVWKLLLPAILVAIGISLIFKDTISSKINKEIKKLNENRTGANEYCATFSGQNVNFDGEEFNGADLSAIFGGVKCDIRKALINGDKIINTTSIFGGIEIYLPQNVKVKVKSTSLFGGVENKALQNTEENYNTIYINAFCLFGGVEIK